MKPRDRFFMMIVLAAIVLFGVYYKTVRPERKQAAAVDGQLSSAQQQLSSAQQGLAQAQQAKAQYPVDYKGLVSLAEAVPPNQDVPALLYEIQAAAKSKSVALESLNSGASGSSTTTPTPATAAAAGAGIESVPFTFTFSGSYLELYHLLATLNDFTTQRPDGTLTVGGRLLTIQGASFTPSGTDALQGTISATAYVLPPAAPGTGTTGPAGVTAPAAPGTTTAPSVPVTAAVAQSTP